MANFINIQPKFLLDPGIIFLNHGSFGATPKSVFSVYQQWQRELEKQPVEFLGRNCHSLLQEARNKISPFLGTSPDNFVFVPNATHGINIVARSLHLEPGAEILTTDHEYGAMDRTWKFLALHNQTDYKIHQFNLPLSDAHSLVDDFFSAVRPKTKVIFLSHISSPSSVIFPIKSICARARQLGILTIIDGAHAPGQLALNLDDLGADFYTGNFHKWLCAPKGSAFLFARPDVQHLVEPLIVSWGWQSETPGISSFQDYLEWTGTQDIASYLSVPAAIQFHAENDWNRRRMACHDMARETHDLIVNQFGLSAIYASDSWYAQMVTIPVPNSLPPDKLKEILYQKYHIEIPVITWHDGIFIRLSVQVYNTRDQLSQLRKALTEIFH